MEPVVPATAVPLARKVSPWNPPVPEKGSMAAASSLDGIISGIILAHDDRIDRSNESVLEIHQL